MANFLHARTHCDAVMYHKFVATAAWLSLAFIAYATLSPIGLRPHVGGPGFEHLAAFAVTGLLFGLAYPRALVPVIVLVLCSACILEVLQLFVPGRHARVSDLVVKLAGGGIGIIAARFWDQDRK